VVDSCSGWAFVRVGERAVGMEGGGRTETCSTGLRISFLIQLCKATGLYNQRGEAQDVLSESQTNEGGAASRPGFSVPGQIVSRT
jgi:hypothetical protein